MTTFDDSTKGINATKYPDFDLSRLPAPLVVGVTGHRDIRDEDRLPLSQAIRSIFLELKGKYSSTPFIVLSALAEGADRLAAQVLLADDVGGRLYVPLPMPRSLYERDFVGDSLSEFRALLAKAEGFLELPLVEGNSLESIAGPGLERDLQYESAGKYIVQKSQILIALWDGAATGLIGGTASVVRFQKEGLPPSELCSFDPPEGFPVYQIVTPHEKNPKPDGVSFQRKVLYPDSFRGDELKAAKYYDRMFTRIDELNKTAMYPDSALGQALLESKRALLKDWPEKQLSEGLRADLNRYALVDALALRFQSDKVRNEKELHWFVFAAFTVFLLGHVSEGYPMVAPVLFGSALALAWIAYWLLRKFRKRDGDTKFEDYRAMAEGLRIRFFWRLVGLRDSVTDYYLGKQRTELDWIRSCFRAWDVRSDFAGAEDAIALRESVELAQVYWITEQRQYFQHAAKREEVRLEHIKRQGNVLAKSAGIVLIIYFCWLSFFSHHFSGGRGETANEWLSFVVELCLAGAALLHNYSNARAYREHAKQYRRMHAIFAQAAKALQNISDPAIALNCIKKLGKEALSENGDWVLLHRERPLDLPHP
jgi:hypothetical protein